MNRVDRCDDHSPLVGPKTGTPLTVRQVSSWVGWLYPLAGIISLVWFLARVLPKPTDAVPPCPHLAVPLALSGFVLWLLGMWGCAVAFHHSRQKLLHARFLLSSGLFVLGLGAALLAVVGGPNGVARAISNETTAPLYSPLLPSDAPNTVAGVAQGMHPGRVAWVYNPAATNGDVTWDNTNGFYWDDNHCSQGVVDSMVPQSVCYLTGAQSAAAAWDTLFHDYNIKHGKGDIGYQPGEKLAINLDLSSSCDFTNPSLVANQSGESNFDQNYLMSNLTASGDQTMYQYATNEADTTPQTVLALLHQLVDVAGVPQNDIYLGDPIRYFLDKIYLPCHASYPNVHYIDCLGQAGREQATYTNGPALFYSTSPMDIINGNPVPGSVMTDQIADFIENSNYLINLAMLKRDESLGCSLCGANNFNAMNRSDAHLDNMLHGPNGWGTGWGTYNATVDQMGNQYLGGKTLLYMVDGLFGGWASNGQDSMPEKWHSMNNWWPSSLFVSQDPVAIDSVGLDFLLMETNQIANCADNYLLEAANANNPPSGTLYDPNQTGTALASLGAHEHWNGPSQKQYTRNLGTGAGIELVSSQPSSIELGSVSAKSGTTINIPINLIAQGMENALSFSVQFDPSVLTPYYPNTTTSSYNLTPGSSLPTSTSQLQPKFLVNASNIANGQLGIALALSPGQAFPAGSQQIATLSFTIKQVTDFTITNVGFSAQPVTPGAVDVNANVLPLGWQAATVTIPYGYEADVTPFPHGKNNGTVTVTDWQEIGLFVSGQASFLDSNGVFQYGEFQRADCAPRGTSGDGSITMADWVQAGRYVAGLDPVVTAGGPSSPSGSTAGALPTLSVRRSPITPSVLTVQPALLRAGVSDTVNVTLTAHGTETALGFTLNFDPELLHFTAASLGSGASKGTLIVNSSQAKQGHVGFALSMPLPKTVAAGKQTVLTLHFTPLSPRAQNTLLSFGDLVVSREVVSAYADVLPSSYSNGTVSIVGMR